MHRIIHTIRNILVSVFLFVTIIGVVLCIVLYTSLIGWSLAIGGMFIMVILALAFEDEPEVPIKLQITATQRYTPEGSKIDTSRREAVIHDWLEQQLNDLREEDWDREDEFEDLDKKPT